MDILKRQFPIKSLLFLKSNCHAKMLPTSRLPCPNWLHRERMRGQDSHETMEVRRFSGHRHRRGKASPQGVPGRSTGPGKDTAGRSECGSGRTGSLTAPAYQSADRYLSQAARKLAVIL